MDIISKPDSLSLLGSMKHVIIFNNKEISFSLENESGESIIKHIYVPNKDGMIDIDLKNIISPLLHFHLDTEKFLYAQKEIARKFSFSVSSRDGSVTQKHSFTVLRAGIDSFADTPENFLQTNWLTWQPMVKGVTVMTPEFLTYYAVKESRIVAEIFEKKEGDGNEYAKKKVTIGDISANSAWTVNVSYIFVGLKFEANPAYYDVWVEDMEGRQLSGKQRYFSDRIKSEDEQWILFENSLGGIDTFRAYGETEFQGKHTHNIAEIEEENYEYRVDTERLYKKDTGYLNEYERRWLLDFFPSLGKYIFFNDSFRKIVLTESDVNYRKGDLPTKYQFTFKFKDARPYLNLKRFEKPSEMEITLPNSESFHIAPRLVECPRQELSGGALLPIQDPYADSWGTTTIDAIRDFLLKKIILSYKGDGTVGHNHKNISILDGLSIEEKYLLFLRAKIYAGYADKAGIAEKISEKFIEQLDFVRKSVDDEIEALLRFRKGLKVGDEDYGINEDGNANLKKTKSEDLIVDNLTVNKLARFFELAIEKMRAIGGQHIISGATAKIEFVKENANLYKCYWRASEEGIISNNEFREDDLVCCQTFANNQKRYYWARVKEVGVAVADQDFLEEVYWKAVVGETYNFISISFEEGDADPKGGESRPKAGDEVTKLGRWMYGDHEKDSDFPDESNAIILSARMGLDQSVKSPSIVQYMGICQDWDLAKHKKNVIAANGNVFNGDMHIQAGGDFERYIKSLPFGGMNLLHGASLRISKMSVDGCSMNLLEPNSGKIEVGNDPSLSHNGHPYLHIDNSGEVVERMTSANFYARIEKGKKYVLSWWERVPKTFDGQIITIQSTYKEGEYSDKNPSVYFGQASRNLTEHADWRRSEEVFVAPVTGVLKVSTLCVKNGEAFLSELMLREGDIVGGWTDPDLSEAISQIDVNTKGIILEIKNSLKKVGILLDLEQEKISAQAGTFEVTDKDGKVKFTVDKDGNLISVGGAKISGLITHNELELTKENKDEFLESGSSRYSQFDVEKLTPIIRIKDDVGKYDFALPPLEHIGLRKYYDNTFYIYNDSQVTYYFWNAFYDLERERIHFGEPYLSLNAGEFIAVRGECSTWQGNEELIWVLISHGKSKK